MGPDSRELHPDVVRFIEERIDSVPHFEALLLLWEGGAMRWSADVIAARLYVSGDRAESILEDLVMRRLAGRGQGEGSAYYVYDAAWDADGQQMTRIASAYRRQLLQVAALIHSRGSAAVRDFARAFRIKKE
jgi:hypothetical protein